MMSGRTSRLPHVWRVDGLCQLSAGHRCHALVHCEFYTQTHQS